MTLGGDMGSALPDGSWIKTARQVTMKGTRVCADLRRIDGTYARDCTVASEGALSLENDIDGQLFDVERGQSFDNVMAGFE